ncbi:hypothetical protein HYW76_03065 [Candidatus Pacearchaeota archaeon]|nr:hypothetical protein [Candidatus Pacearchaeota archaeon]
MERNIKFIILMIIIFLFFNISLTTSFKDFFSVIWQNQTDCKNSLNVRLLTDQIKIDLPRDKQCNDLSAELKIEDNQFCYSKDFKMISQIYTQINSYGNISCIVFL